MDPCLSYWVTDFLCFPLLDVGRYIVDQPHLCHFVTAALHTWYRSLVLYVVIPGQPCLSQRPLFTLQHYTGQAGCGIIQQWRPEVSGQSTCGRRQDGAFVMEELCLLTPVGTEAEKSLI